MHISQTVEDKHGVEPVGKLMKKLLSHGTVYLSEGSLLMRFSQNKNIRWDHAYLQSHGTNVHDLSGVNTDGASYVMSAAGLRHVAIIYTINRWSSFRIESCQPWKPTKIAIVCLLTYSIPLII